MRLFARLVLFVALFAVPVALWAHRAEAYEAPLGIIVVSDAGAAGFNQGLNVTSNLTTANPFRITAQVPITVQPDVAAYVCVETTAPYDAGYADGGWVSIRAPSCRQSDGGSFGVLVAAGTAFPSSCGQSRPLSMEDGGFSSCVVGCVPSTGTSVTCLVSQRQANHSPPEF